MILTRREFLRLSAGAGAAVPALAALDRLARLVEAAPSSPVRNIKDVLEFSTRPQGWKGLFGFVTFRLHPVFFNGQLAYHVRTDASDREFAARQGLVFVPKLAKGLDAGATADYYEFSGGTRDQLPVISTIPGQRDFTPAFRIHRALFMGKPTRLTSVQDVEGARDVGRVRVVSTTLVVNYPLVKWPGGELAHDRERTAYLGQGQLLNPPDTTRLRVTFKLHQCFPGEWYIITDNSAMPMASAMRVSTSPRSAQLTKAGATAKILVFGNGIRGPGPMGFQPSVVDSRPGNPVWSPFWDHYTFTWVDGRRPGVVRDQSTLLDEESAGNLKRWPGTPTTNGRSFVVNCPVPVTAPVTWRSSG